MTYRPKRRQINKKVGGSHFSNMHEKESSSTSASRRTLLNPYLAGFVCLGLGLVGGFLIFSDSKLTMDFLFTAGGNPPSKAEELASDTRRNFSELVDDFNMRLKQLELSSRFLQKPGNSLEVQRRLESLENKLVDQQHEGVFIASDKRAEYLEEALANYKEVKSRLIILESKMGSFEEEVVNLKKGMGNNLNTAESRSQISHSLGESSKRIGKIELFAEETLSKLVFLNALENFRRTVYGGRSLADSFGKLVNESDLLKDQEIKKILGSLVPYIEKGVSNRNQLYKRFSNLTPKLLATHRKQISGNWFQRGLANLASIVVIRDINKLPEDVVDAVILKAEKAISEDDLESAVAYLKGLNSRPGSLLFEWLKDSQARLRVEFALDRLDQLAANNLANR